MGRLAAIAVVAWATAASTAVSACSSASDAGGGGTTACTGDDGATCPNGGGALQLCVTSSDDQCTGAFFKVGSQTFPCTSCIDTSDCSTQAEMVCYGDGGSGGSSTPVDGGSRDGCKTGC